MLNWFLGYSSSLDEEPAETLEIAPYQDDPNVPGEAQLIMCRAGLLPDYNYASNSLKYKWCEDVYWHYTTLLDVRKKPGFEPYISLSYLDYRYTIRANGKVLADSEGMFTPVVLSLAEFEGSPVKLEVIIHPVPKVPGAPDTRDQARESVKPPVSYGWDWHPRLVTAGISGEVKFDYRPLNRLSDIEFDYTLTDSLDLVKLSVEAGVVGVADKLICELIDSDCEVVASSELPLSGDSDIYTLSELTLREPKLWWPARQGDQNLYTLRVALISGNETVDEYTKKIGFRRVKLVMNEGSWYAPTPATQASCPFTLEINNRRIFAKGSNFVSADIFYSKINIDTYRSLCGLALEANMNIFRMWGGSPVNKDEFFELCDKLGMMVWQEFPLSCNNYPDKPEYLDTLEREATSIVQRLKGHPSVVLWCGGNELFNSWSGMTNQSHALRLLDKVTYDNDRNTPFIMTSPVYNVGHGPYVNIVDDRTGKEAIELFMESPRSAYTEFGCPGPAPLDYIRQYIDEEDVQSFFGLHTTNTAVDGNGLKNADPDKTSPWYIHHAIGAHYPEDTWFRINEIYRYFYKTESIAECCELGQIIQGACYKVMFEEARRKWPATSMAINWCWNEPWPCFANNSLVSYPNVLRLAYFDVRQALRDQMLSIKFPRLRHAAGEDVKLELWALNDLPETLKGCDYTIYIDLDDEEETRIELDGGSFGDIKPLSSTKIGELTFKVPENVTKTYTLTVKCKNDELTSTYTLFSID